MIRLCSVVGANSMCSAARLINRSGVPHTLSPLGVEWLWKSVLTQPGVETDRLREVFISSNLPFLTSICFSKWSCSIPRVTTILYFPGVKPTENLPFSEWN